MATTLWVNLPLEQVLEKIEDGVTGLSLTGQLIDTYTVDGGNGHRCIVQVYEKYYYRSSNYASLTVTVDDFASNDSSGCTRVHLMGSGGSGSVFNFFDWGASSSFEDVAQQALQEWIIRS